MFRELIINPRRLPAVAGVWNSCRRKSVRIAQVAALVSAPLLLFAYSSNPPLSMSGAPGETTCAGCHGSLTQGSGVTIAFPSGLTYIPGGAAESLTVSSPQASSGGFELSARASSGNGQAGSFTAGTNSGVGASGSIQYVYQTARATSWTFQWTPPATNLGNVIMYVVGVNANGQTFSNTYTLTPAAGGGGGNMLTTTPSMLTFNASGGAAPASQSVHVTSSGGSINFTTSASTTSGGNWLSAMPAGGSTPLDVSVSVNPAGLAAGTYMGVVAIASASATNSPQNVSVTMHVTATTPPPTTPSISLNPASLTFNSTGGAAVMPKTVQVASTGSPLSFSTSAATMSGGNWLSIDMKTGTTPATVSISAMPSGLADGTYTGSVTFTASGAANSPKTLAVTLIVGPATPPLSNPGTLTYSLHVLDKQSDGADYMLISGQGSINNGKLTGSGHFTRFTMSRDERHHIVAMGTWTAKTLISYSEASAGSTSGGVLEIDVELTPTGGAASSATMRIADTGADRGVTLAIDGGPTFDPTGTGYVSLHSGTSGTSGDPEEDGASSSGSTRTPAGTAARRPE